MKSKLSKTWMPSENVLSLAKSRGMPIEDWLYHLIPEWKLYWLERNVLRCWDSVFWNWAKRCWEKVDKSRMYRGNANDELNFQAKITNPKIKWAIRSITPEQSIENFNRQAEIFKNN